MAAARKSDSGIGRDGNPYELESWPAHEVNAKPGEPGHDDALGPETVRRRHRSRFEQYAYDRFDKDQINAFEIFRRQCEIVASGTLSQSRYGKEAGSIDCASYGERELYKNVRLMDAARQRRKAVAEISKVNCDAKKALCWAADDDLTPREIGERLRRGPAPKSKQLREREDIGRGFDHLFIALNIIVPVYKR